MASTTAFGPALIKPLSSRPSNWLLALAAAGAAAVGVFAAAMAAPAPAGVCADAELIMIRGSSEALPGGAQLPPLAAQVTAAATSAVTTFGLPYPASLDYAASVASGTLMLADHLTQRASACPQQRYVITGFSQGAQVARTALTNGSVPPGIAGRIAAVVLYGDPTRMATEPFNLGTAAAGSAGPFVLHGAPLTAFADRTRSYCDSMDIICTGVGGVAVHTTYASVYTKTAADFITARIDAGVTAGGGAPSTTAPGMAEGTGLAPPSASVPPATALPPGSPVQPQQP